MSPVLRRVALDVILAILGLTLLVGALVVLVDGVESARLLGEGASTGAWLAQVLALGPGRVVSALPVVVAAAVVWVHRRWSHTGRWVGLQACGISPTRVTVWVALGALLASVAALGARELAAPLTAPVLAPRSTWIELPSDEGLWVFRADELVGDRAQGVRGMRVHGSELVSTFRVQALRWHQGRWQVEPAHGSAEPLPPLPSPSRWRELGMGPGPEAPVGALVKAPPSSTRVAWLGGRLLLPLLLTLLAVLTLQLSRRGPQWAVVALVGAGVLGLLRHGLLTAVASGAWPAWLGLGLPVVLAAALVGLAATRARPCGRPWTRAGRG